MYNLVSHMSPFRFRYLRVRVGLPALIDALGCTFFLFDHNHWATGEAAERTATEVHCRCYCSCLLLQLFSVRVKSICVCVCVCDDSAKVAHCPRLVQAVRQCGDICRQLVSQPASHRNDLPPSVQCARRGVADVLLLVEVFISSRSKSQVCCSFRLAKRTDR